jgi:hypothetical protein
MRGGYDRVMSQNGPENGLQNGADGSCYGITVGTRWRDGNDATTIVVLWVQRSGVVVYRREGAAVDDECVTNVVRFIETFAPANDASGCRV